MDEPVAVVEFCDHRFDVESRRHATGTVHARMVLMVDGFDLDIKTLLDDFEENTLGTRRPQPGINAVLFVEYALQHVLPEYKDRALRFMTTEYEPSLGQTKTFCLIRSD